MKEMNTSEGGIRARKGHEIVKDTYQDVERRHTTISGVEKGVPILISIVTIVNHDAQNDRSGKSK
jgi:hypothetical protein